MQRTYIHAAGLVATGASTLGAIYSAAHGGSEGWGWAWTFGVYGVGAALCWRWALKESRALDAKPNREPARPVPVTVADVDPVMMDLHRKLAVAIRDKKARSHLRVAIYERNKALLAGGAR